MPPSTTVFTPTQVTGISSGATDVAAGNRTTCAIVSTVDFCWGHNNFGQVGDGTTTDRSIPTAVVGVGGSAFRASLSDRYSCVLSNNAGVGAQCWGKNDLNQLGDGTNVSRVDLAYVSGLSAGVVSFSAGTNAHGCAVVTRRRSQVLGLQPRWRDRRRTRPTPRPSPVNVSGF